MPRDAIHVVGEPRLPIPHLVKNTELGARALRVRVRVRVRATLDLI